MRTDDSRASTSGAAGARVMTGRARRGAIAIAIIAAAACKFDSAYRDAPAQSSRRARGDGRVPRRGARDVRGGRAVVDGHERLRVARARVRARPPRVHEVPAGRHAVRRLERRDDVRAGRLGLRDDVDVRRRERRGVPRRRCTNLCEQAATIQSNVGCEYWGADLDNADDCADAATRPRSSTRSSSPTRSPTCPPTSRSSRTTQPGEPAQPGRGRGRRSSRRSNLEVFKLGPREVDGSRRRRVQHRHAHRADAPRLPCHHRLPGRRLPVQPARQRQRLLERRVSAPQAASRRSSDPGAAAARTSWPAGRRPSRSTDDPTTNFGPPSTSAPSSPSSARTPNTHVRVHTTARRDRRAARSSTAIAARRRIIDVDAPAVRRAQPRDRATSTPTSPARSSTPISRRRVLRAARPPTRRTSRRSPTAAAAPITWSISSPRCAPSASRTSLAHDAEPHQAVIEAGGRITPIDRARVLPRRGRADRGDARHDDAPRAGGRIRPRATRATSGPSRRRRLLLTARSPSSSSQVQPSQDAAGVPRGLAGRRSEPALPRPRRAVAHRLRASHAGQVRVRLPRRRRAVAAHVYLDAPPLDATDCEVSASGRAHRGGARRPDAAVLDYATSSLPSHRSDASAAEQHLARRQNDGVHHVAGGRAGGRHRLRLRLVRELRVRGRHAAHGDRPAVSHRRSARAATARAAADAPPRGPAWRTHARTRRRDAARAERRRVGGVGVHELRRRVDAVVVRVARQIHEHVTELVRERQAALARADPGAVEEHDVAHARESLPMNDSPMRPPPAKSGTTTTSMVRGSPSSSALRSVRSSSVPAIASMSLKCCRPSREIDRADAHARASVVDSGAPARTVSTATSAPVLACGPTRRRSGSAPGADTRVRRDAPPRGRLARRRARRLGDDAVGRLAADVETAR